MMVEHTDKKFILWMSRKMNILEEEFLEDRSEAFVDYCAEKYDELTRFE